MNIAEKLGEGHSKAINNQIVKYIGDSPVRFKELMRCFLSSDYRISQRASWALGDVAVRHPLLIDQYHRVLFDCLKEKQKHNSIKRNIVRTYQVANIPEDYEAELYDICLNFVANTEEAIAVKAFSIRVCERIIEKYPEMSNELFIVIKSNIAIWSSGLKNRGNKFLKRWS